MVLDISGNLIEKMAIELTFLLALSQNCLRRVDLNSQLQLSLKYWSSLPRPAATSFYILPPPLPPDVNSFCPGSVFFTPTTITWYLPKHIDPLISSGQFRLLEVRMGIDGQRLDAAEMAARQYSLFINDRHIIVEIPVGAVGGHFKVSGTWTFTVFFKSVICATSKTSLVKSNLFHLHNFCRVMSRMMNTSLLTQLSQWSRCSGLKTPLTKTLDTKSCSPSPHHCCLDLHKLLTVSLVITVLCAY